MHVSSQKSFTHLMEGAFTPAPAWLRPWTETFRHCI